MQDTLNSVYRLSGFIAIYGLQLELIVVDGGSSDSTLDIANSYRNRFNNFSILQNVSGGPYRAMNAGLKCAKGEYSFILNSDDFIAYPKEYAEFIISALAINSFVLLSSITYFRRPSLVARHMWKIEPIDTNRAIWKNKILSGLHYPHPGFIAKTDIYLSTMFDETYSLSADYKLMQTIANHFGTEVGYSDHTEGIEVSIAAVSLGASVIEKHMTLDRSAAGPDHFASLEPQKFAEMVKYIRAVECALGTGLKEPSDSEFENIAIVRKSIVASKIIKKGEVFSEDNLTTKRPGNGISPMLWDEVVGQRASRDFLQDELIVT